MLAFHHVNMFAERPAKSRAFRFWNETAPPLCEGVSRLSSRLSDRGQTYAKFPRYGGFAFRDGDAQDEGAVPAYPAPPRGRSLGGAAPLRSGLKTRST